MSKLATIISAFPGCGKSMTCHLLGKNYKLLDSDSSLFDKTDFPKNYIKHIIENMNSADIIFVSSHESVRNALIENNIDFTLFYPNISRKDEFIMNYKNRGNNSSFIKFLSENFDKFISDIKNENGYNKIELINEDDFIMNNEWFKNILKKI